MNLNESQNEIAERELLSNKHTLFYRKWSILILIGFCLFFTLFILLSSSNQPKIFVLSGFALMSLIGFIQWYRTYPDICEVWLINDRLMVKTKKKTFNFQFAETCKIWQEIGFFTRLIYISFKDENGALFTIKFMGTFESNYKGAHHPVIDKLNKKLERSVNPNEK